MQMITTQCRRLRKVVIMHAPRLSNDAVAYLVTLPELTDLCLAWAAGLTDQAMNELASAPNLRSLDLSRCPQLTEAGVVAFAKAIAAPGGPRVQCISMDWCPHLGRETAKALASLPLHRCSLSSCSPMPIEAQAWEGMMARGNALRALGLEAPKISCDYEDVTEESSSFNKPLATEKEDEDEAGLCAICLDEISKGEPVWQCPVCFGKLHNTEDCARGWLRFKQSCPTCRAAVWAPPKEEPEPVIGSRRRPVRASSADPALEATPSMSLPTLHSALVRSNRPSRVSQPDFNAAAFARMPGGRQVGTPGRRPPRPIDTVAVPIPPPRSVRNVNSSARSRSVPTKRSESMGLALVGASIVSATRM